VLSSPIQLACIAASEDHLRGKIMTAVPPARGFNPPQPRDDGLWPPAIDGGASLQPDPLQARLRFVQTNRPTGGALQAAGFIGDAPMRSR